ncbi:hypothetical protein AEAC466_19490 [Asticcacaulis sp. AC466]|nr:hypothetical protein AEAC466_19490 [Asticcacaulis sp. AC466]
MLQRSDRDVGNYEPVPVSLWYHPKRFILHQGGPDMTATRK